MNDFFIDVFLKTHLGWWANPVGAVLWLVATFFSLLVFGYGDFFHNLERKACREGMARKSLGPDWPYVISCLMAIGLAVNASATLWNLRGKMHFGMAMSNQSVATLPFGAQFPIPGELAICTGVFAMCWYVPVALCLLSFLRRVRVFKSFGAGARYLLIQMISANAAYWLYGIAIAFLVMPVPVGLFHVAKDVYFAVKDWAIVVLVWNLALMGLFLIVLGLVGALPFLSGHWLVGAMESMLFYRRGTRGIGWLPVAGSAIVAAFASVPVEWRNLCDGAAFKLEFFGGPKAVRTASVLNWSRSFELPQGMVEVYSRMHWEIPAILVVAAFLFRIRAFRGIFHAVAQLIVLACAAYVTAAFYCAFYGEFFFMAIVGLFIGAGLTAKPRMPSPLEEAQKREEEEKLKKEEEERRKQKEEEEREEEYRRDHKELPSDSFFGPNIKIERRGCDWWGDDGHKYHENLDGTFTRED